MLTCNARGELTPFSFTSILLTFIIHFTNRTSVNSDYKWFNDMNITLQKSNQIMVNPFEIDTQQRRWMGEDRNVCV